MVGRPHVRVVDNGRIVSQRMGVAITGLGGFGLVYRALSSRQGLADPIVIAGNVCGVIGGVERLCCAFVSPVVRWWLPHHQRLQCLHSP